MGHPPLCGLWEKARECLHILPHTGKPNSCFIKEDLLHRCFWGLCLGSWRSFVFLQSLKTASLGSRCLHPGEERKLKRKEFDSVPCPCQEQGMHRAHVCLCLFHFAPFKWVHCIPATSHQSHESSAPVSLWPPWIDDPPVWSITLVFPEFQHPSFALNRGLRLGTRTMYKPAQVKVANDTCAYGHRK